MVATGYLMYTQYVDQFNRQHGFIAPCQMFNVCRAPKYIYARLSFYHSPPAGYCVSSALLRLPPDFVSLFAMRAYPFHMYAYLTVHQHVGKHIPAKRILQQWQLYFAQALMNTVTLSTSELWYPSSTGSTINTLHKLDIVHSKSSAEHKQQTDNKNITVVHKGCPCAICLSKVQSQTQICLATVQRAKDI